MISSTKSPKQMTTKQYIGTQTRSLQIINFDNYNVTELEELIPEESNCGKRKQSGRSGPKQEVDQGISFIHCNLISLVGMKTLMHETLWFPDNLVYLNVSNNQLTTLEGIQACPNLKTLLALGNKLKNIEDLNLLEDLKHIINLGFQGNPVVLVTMYRPYMIQKFKNLKKLDGNPILEQEREQCENLETIKGIVLRPPVLIQGK